MTLQTTNHYTQLPAIKELLHEAKVTSSFWRGRCIVTQRRECVSLHFIAKKIAFSALHHAVNDDLSLLERLAGIAIARKINTFYSAPAGLIDRLRALFGYSLQTHYTTGLVEKHFRGMKIQNFLINFDDHPFQWNRELAAHPFYPNEGEEREYHLSEDPLISRPIEDGRRLLVTKLSIVFRLWDLHERLPPPTPERLPR